jgi:catechol 2,3-dioxygenase-like lactoylglutathione lyase family enzyme
MHPTQGSRIAHWVLKIGDLKRSLTFFEGVLGLRGKGRHHATRSQQRKVQKSWTYISPVAESVLRHEEFEEGCEATCNGMLEWVVISTSL